jgi:hypothetical protein
MEHAPVAAELGTGIAVNIGAGRSLVDTGPRSLMLENRESVSGAGTQTCHQSRFTLVRGQTVVTDGMHGTFCCVAPS